MSGEKTIRFVDRSDFLVLAQRQFPRGWRFFPFDLDPQEAVARLVTRLGIERDGVLVALACLREGTESTGPATLNFFDGSPDDLRRLLTEIHRRYAGRQIATMIPMAGDRTTALLPIVREMNYESWDDYTAAVFSYSLEHQLK